MKFHLNHQSQPSLQGRYLLPCAALLALGALGIAMLPDQLISWPAVLAGFAGLIACAWIAGLLMKVLGASELSRAIARLALIFWFVLLVSEHVFVRRGLPEQVLGGNFGVAAYLEVASWCVLLVPVMFVLLAHTQILSTVLKTGNRWCLLFALLALVSAAYSPLPGFSLVWALKLCIAGLILQMWFYAARDRTEVTKFWAATFWAVAALVVLPLLSLLSHPSTAFGWRGFSGDMDPEYRLNTNIHPVDLTQLAGLLLIVAIAMYCRDGRRGRIVWILFAAVIMILSGGKAAILAGIFCSGLLLVLLKRIKRAALVCLLLVLIGASLLAFTPLGNYLSTYQDSETASTLTGRTELWESALPLIYQAPIFGHGFMASKFVGQEADAGWDAGHLHNAYLEVLYNNGLFGLILILLIQFTTVRNLMRALKTSAGPAKVMTAGAFAILVYLSLNAIVEPTFGGRPSWSFLLFLALVPFSDKLRQFAPGAESVSRRQSPAIVRGYSPATSL